MKGDPEAVRTIQSALNIRLPFVALAEMRAGFAGGDPRLRGHNEGLLLRFLGLAGVEVLYADQETTEVYARLFVELKRAGTPIPANDLWIAALAVQHHLALYTRDQHFRMVPQVALC
ncbi:MAG: PIN domain-containing protein [Candidatus Solibacter usitatus]|nr:PIN domain-containing protein [Candidatus Solibacter usitatus]